MGVSLLNLESETPAEWVTKQEAYVDVLLLDNDQIRARSNLEQAQKIAQDLAVSEGSELSILLQEVLEMNLKDLNSSFRAWPSVLLFLRRVL